MGAWDKFTGWLSGANTPAAKGAKAAPAEPLVDQAIALAQFDQIEVRGPLTVEWQPGASAAVATMAAKDQGLLSVVVEGGKLIASMPEGSSPARLSARSASLTALMCFGEAGGRAVGVKAEVFRASLERGLDLTVQGQAIVGRLSLSGEGSVDAGSLECQALVAKVAGSGMMTGRATGSAEVEISGGGEVEVWGNPPTTITRREGPGRVQMGPGRNGGEAPNEESGIFGHIPLPKK